MLDTVNLKSLLWLSRMFLIQSIDEAAVGPCVAHSASYRPVEKCRPQTSLRPPAKLIELRKAPSRLDQRGNGEGRPAGCRGAPFSLQ